MATKRFDLVGENAITQYADFELELTDIDLSLDGYLARASLRRNYLANAAIDFAIAFLKRTRPGAVKLRLSSAQTGALVTGTYVWGLLLQSPEPDVQTIALIEGSAIVKPGAVRGFGLL